MANQSSPKGFTHERIETNNFLMIVLVTLVVAVGGLVEIVPLFFQKSTTQPLEGVKPYGALQLAGRDVYISEGCYNCHSQMIRPFQAETLRYGPYSVAGEFVYDRPFQWGSKRTGPDLARVGGKYSDAWHIDHLTDPQSVVPESVMPGYGYLLKAMVNADYAADVVETHAFVGVPYSEEMLDAAATDVLAQIDPNSDDYDALLERYPGAQIRNFDGAPGVSEMDALVAYLQMLGTTVDFSTFTPDASR